ncbi:hypothetical protein [Pseudoalteromonas peptidolytica]|uniref:hypothetical protein n=1 Tax=Pseudoalteromonas peptidolytica TaxID=61150 RepID=UPI00298EAE1C|nr:hypothetical protein [Pseudoalteromonas peptidolytica]MDW7548551.1 hypothetical protein [Pseudoalteromonas peptidolytica]
MRSLYPNSNRGRRVRRPRPERNQTRVYIEQVVVALKANPDKINIIKRNCSEYRQQSFLKRGFLLAIERFDWVFAIDDDVHRICEQILADDYIGKRLRRYPLLFRGVLND